MTDDYCECSYEEGQTFIGEIGSNGQMICSICHKELQPKQQENVKCVTPDQIHDLLDGHPRKVHLIGWERQPAAVLICKGCGEMTFWSGPKTILEEMVSDFRECDLIICPVCKTPRWISDEAREMMR